MATTEPIPAASPPRDHMPLNGIDHVELWVGNAAQAAYYLTRAFGFARVAYRGLETGSRDRTSHVLEQGRVRLVVTGTLRSGTDVAAHHARHGDGVKVIALSVPDVDDAYREATARGATGVAEPALARRRARQRADRRHRDLRRHRAPLRRPRATTPGAFLPGYAAVPAAERRRPAARRHRPHRRQRRARRDGALGQVLRGRLRDDGDDPLLRRGDLDGVLGADVEGRRRPATAGSSSRSTSPPRAGASRRSTSTSSSTRAPARSTSRSRRATSSGRSRR